MWLLIVDAVGGTAHATWNPKVIKMVNLVNLVNLVFEGGCATIYFHVSSCLY